MINYTTITELDRSLYESVRLKLVSEGIYPDILQYPTPEAFESAKEAMRQQGIILTEPVGVSSTRDKLEKGINRVVILRDSIEIGGFSSSASYIYAGFYKKVLKGDYVEEEYVDPVYFNEAVERDELFYKKYKLPSSQKIVNYDMRLITSNIEEERKLLDIFYSIFDTHTKIHPITSDGNYDTARSVELTIGNSRNLNVNDNLLELSIPIMTLPVWLGEPVLVQSDIPAFRGTKINGIESMAGIVVTNKITEKIKENDDFVPLLA